MRRNAISPTPAARRLRGRLSRALPPYGQVSAIPSLDQPERGCQPARVQLRPPSLGRLVQPPSRVQLRVGPERPCAPERRTRCRTGNRIMDGHSCQSDTPRDGAAVAGRRSEAERDGRALYDQRPPARSLPSMGGPQSQSRIAYFPSVGWRRAPTPSPVSSTDTQRSSATAAMCDFLTVDPAYGMRRAGEPAVLRRSGSVNR
jgi:hypothetical protein